MNIYRDGIGYLEYPTLSTYKVCYSESVTGPDHVLKIEARNHEHAAELFAYEHFGNIEVSTKNFPKILQVIDDEGVARRVRLIADVEITFDAEVVEGL